MDGRMVPLEIVLLMRCRGIPGVIQTIDWFERPDGYMIVMERPSPSTDLFDYISEKGALTESVARDYFRQVVDTVLACYRVNVIHRDIKDENLVVDMKNGLVKLIDFGSGAFHKEGPYTDFEVYNANCERGALIVTPSYLSVHHHPNSHMPFAEGVYLFIGVAPAPLLFSVSFQFDSHSV
ncbi:unnamed protein product [Strongylus vulgaris]|uniref:Serine/threonine-protein kinase 1 n=1 Tax=Strongylus vulgaris TaxID=40348 RepID=A0A3P7IN69_STRVU|nr:unnamed protein product [Strongylus vulgaris]